MMPGRPPRTKVDEKLGETTTDFDEDMPEFGDEGAGSSAKKQKTSSELKVFANIVVN